MGMSVGAIPWDVTDRYATRAGLDEENAWVFCKVISAMDQVYLEWVDEETKRKREENK